MPYKRLEVNELVKTISQANSVTNGWDVLCSYDLQALNRVLLEEYKKFPVNSQLNFFTNSTISPKIRETLDFNLKFDNPTLSFSSIQSGIYDLKIPISDNAYCNAVTFYKGNFDTNITTYIPPGYNILASGPLKTIKVRGRHKVINSADEIVEFGNSNQANIVLHFGKDLGQVEIPRNTTNSDLNDSLDTIETHFRKNIKEVDYNIVPVVSETAKLGDVILTPKSFIMTTMANPNNTGVLNVWIQTHESENPQGNPQPSFYPGSNILPITKKHDSSIIFSKQLMKKLYFRHSLEKNFDVNFTDMDPYTNNPINGIGIKLVPKKNKLFGQNLTDVYNDLHHNIVAILLSSKNLECTTLKINYNDTPLYLLIQDGIYFKCHWYQEFKCSLSTMDQAPDEMPQIITRDGQFKIELNINQFIQQRINNYSIDSTTYHVHDKQNITITAIKSLDDMDYIHTQDKIRAILEYHISQINCDFISLNYFAEANILFNEERFKIANDKAIYFPGDTIIIGDIEERQDTHNIRHKRHYSYDKKFNLNINAIDHTDTEVSESTSNAAISITSPVNTAINWLSSSLSPANIMTNYGFIKDSIQSIFTKPEQIEQINSDNIKNDNVTSINIGQFDINASLTLANFITRYFTKVKPHNAKEESIDLLGVKAYVLNIITEFEELLNDPSIQNYLPIETIEFDPVVLMSKLEQEVINDNYTEIGKILHRSIINNNSTLDDTQFSSYIEDKISEILTQQNPEHSYNQQLISDYSSNNHTTA